MAFTVRTHAQPGVSKLDPTIHVLEDGTGNRAEVWPALGFNCFRWQTPHAGAVLDLLYADPALFADGRPTRSGIPILFPFPNRIRGGRFVWAGKEYTLPLNDGPVRNAIHGFACRRPWRVLDSGADGQSAWVTGAFRGTLDATDCVALWPADYELRLTYRLGTGSLRLEAEIGNPDSRPLPYGLGYHPYFRLPFTPDGRAEDCIVQVPARSFWELEDCLPTGKRRPVDSARDLNAPRPFASVTVDDVLTELSPASGALAERGVLRSGGAALRVLCTPEFREMVIFTPGNRQAFCVEPYTCTTDAVNLPAGESGWAVLSPGQRATNVVELRVG
jgi:aldose 1-epimerase